MGLLKCSRTLNFGLFVPSTYMVILCYQSTLKDTMLICLKIFYQMSVDRRTVRSTVGFNQKVINHRHYTHRLLLPAHAAVKICTIVNLHLPKAESGWLSWVSCW